MTELSNWQKIKKRFDQVDIMECTFDIKKFDSMLWKGQKYNLCHTQSFIFESNFQTYYYGNESMN